MIDVKIIKRRRTSGTTSPIAAGRGYGRPSSSSDHALTADEATHALRADEATHAASAVTLDPDSPVRREFLSRLADDVAAGHITFEQGFTALLTAMLRGGAHFGEFVSGSAGAAVDAAGAGEFESITSRSFLKVFELIYNRLNTLEGDTSFSDSATIETIDGEGSVITAHLRRRWENDVTALQPGDIIFGYVNDLTTSGTYGRAWGWVRSVDRVNNAIDIAIYPDAEVPGGVNLPFAPHMIVTRRGNNIAPTAATAANPDYAAFIIPDGNGAWVNVRQKCFYISTDDGRLTQLTGVDRPIVSRDNHALILGCLPDGLLDAQTSQLINRHQPYLYARGIVARDIIRIDYSGAVVRTALYRGLYRPGQQYTSTDSSFDTVTHGGALWQCVASTSSAPADDNPAWLRMTSARLDSDDLRVFTIIPSAASILIGIDSTVRHPVDGLTCTVTMTSAAAGLMTITDTATLDSLGVGLWVAVGDDDEVPYLPTARTTIDAEDGSPLETESGELFTAEALAEGEGETTLFPASDRPLTFILRRTSDGAELARAVVPVVYDGLPGVAGPPGEPGQQGLPGRDGLMVYMQGIFNSDTTYTSTDDTAPVVYHAGQYYCLNPGCQYRGADETRLLANPALDVANNIDAPRWRLFDKFQAIYTDILMAEFGRVGGAIFFGDWIISRKGTLNGVESEEYEHFRDGSFIPYYAVNLREGTIRGRGSFEAGTPGGARVSLDGDRQRLVVYDAANDERTVLEGATYNSPQEVLGSAAGDIDFGDNATGSMRRTQLVTPKTTSAILARFSTDTPTELHIRGSIEATASAAATPDTGSFINQGIARATLVIEAATDNILPDGTIQIGDSVTLATVTATAEDSDTTQRPDDSRTIDFDITVRLPAGAHGIVARATLSGDGFAYTAAVAWRGLEASFNSDFYVSRLFANGICLGQRSDNFAMIYKTPADGMRMLVCNNGYGIDISNQRPALLHRGHRVDIPLPLLAGRVSNSGSAYKSTLRTFDSSTPAVERLATGRVQITYPDAWADMGLDDAAAVTITPHVPATSAAIEEHTPQGITIATYAGTALRDAAFDINIQLI